MQTPYGFLIRGATFETRRLVDATAALVGFAGCDPRAKVRGENYLSAFWFGADFRDHLRTTDSTRNYRGSCWAPFLWFDVDRDGDLAAALHDARQLAQSLIQRCALKEEDLWLFFSGSKGFHLGLPTGLWSPEPGPNFHRIAHRFCERQAQLCSVTIDRSVYDKVRAFRAPNSRHPKTGRHKRPLTLDELMYLKIERILEMAREPLDVEVPKPSRTSDQAAADWREAATAVERLGELNIARRSTSIQPRLNRLTLEFIRAGASPGERNRRLFSAAANLAEFDCPPELAHALLTEAALDSGLPPREVLRTIANGLAGTGGGA